MKLFYLLPLFILSACGCEYCNPWVGMDYAEAGCHTDKAILTTSGCITTPPAGGVTDTNRPVSQPNDTGISHNDRSNGDHISVDNPKK